MPAKPTRPEPLLRVRFDPDHGWVDDDSGLPLSGDEADELGLDPSLLFRTVQTPAGPAVLPADAEVHFVADHLLSARHPVARLIALCASRPCTGGCGQRVDTSLRCYRPDGADGGRGTPILPEFRSRCGRCGPQVAKPRPLTGLPPAGTPGQSAAEVYVVITIDPVDGSIRDLEVLDGSPRWDTEAEGQQVFIANVNGGDSERWYPKPGSESGPPPCPS
jgi:hypothetical protein